MSAGFVARMEDVLELYAEPYDPQRPVVCFDETSTQLLSDVRPPLPAEPGKPRREDYEYRREGARNLFLSVQPLAGWRHVAVTERRTVVDFAQQMRWLVDEAYPDVPVVRVVLDNLNTHRKASLYQTFPPAEARRIAKPKPKWDVHFGYAWSWAKGLSAVPRPLIAVWSGNGSSPPLSGCPARRGSC